MKRFRYKNIQLTDKLKKANCVTHSGMFHVDDIISTVFLSKILKKVSLIRVPSTNELDLNGKIVYDIGLGKFDHHQSGRNGKRDNGIYYSSIGLLWKEFGHEYLTKLNVKNIDKVFNYIDTELIQYIDATDNVQIEYLENKISPDFVKLCNPEWNEDLSVSECFIKALKLADDFWDIYVKHAIAEVEAIEIIVKKTLDTDEIYAIFDKELPYRKAVNYIKNKNIKYLIFKSKRECYDIRIIDNKASFKKEIITDDIKNAKNVSEINDLIYVDCRGKLCCTTTLESAIKLIEYNEKSV